MNYFSSDFHVEHLNMARNRGFISAKEMEDCIVDNFNSIVSKRDIFFHLGDFYWTNDMEGIRKFIAKLNCKKIIFLKGNHDKPLMKFMKATKNSRLELHSDYFLKDNGCNLHLYHYPIFDYDGRYNTENYGEKYWHLYGHQHNRQNGELMGIKGAVNVNVDMNDYKPLNIDDIKRIVDEQD